MMNKEAIKSVNQAYSYFNMFGRGDELLSKFLKCVYGIV